MKIYFYQIFLLLFTAIPILSLWCSWALGTGSPKLAREQIEEVLRLGGADPFSGKLFWDARFELEKTQLDSLRYSLMIYHLHTLFDNYIFFKVTSMIKKHYIHVAKKKIE